MASESEAIQKKYLDGQGWFRGALDHWIEDLVNESFARMFRPTTRKNFDCNRAIAIYLCKVAKNLAIENALLKSRFVSRPIAHRTLQTACEGESAIAKRIENFEDQLPAHIKLAYLPTLGQVRLRLTGNWPGEVTPDAALQLDRELDAYKAELKALIPDLIFGEEEDSLQGVVGEILRQQGKQFGTAESCTGGYVAHLITSIPGASDYFPGSIVSYSYEMKAKLLGVKSATLEKFGAVSEEAVREMAEGARATLGVDVSLAISGIAGPGGGIPDKPVGTVWMAISDSKRTIVAKHIFGRDRIKNIQLTGVYALNMVRKFLLE